MSHTTGTETAVVVATNGSKRLVQIGSVQVEVDLASARPASCFRIGETVRVLEKDYSSIKSYTGFIVEFVEAFRKPALLVAVVRPEYGRALSVDFVTYTGDDDRLALMPLHVRDFDLDEALSILDAQIARDRATLQDLMHRRNAFAHAFGRHDEREHPVLLNGRRHDLVQDVELA